MKIQILIATIFLLLFCESIAQVGIGTQNPVPSAILDISSTTKGVALPRLTTANRLLIPAPVQGLIVYDEDTASLWFFDGSIWNEISHTDSKFIDGTNPNDAVYMDGNVGIGTSIPIEKLHVNGNILAASSGTPDYVFESYYEGISLSNITYRMWSLDEIENFIEKNKHLPGVPSAEEVISQGGILINQSTEINLEKIEEIFLHIIELNKSLKELINENENLKERIKILEEND